MPHPSLPSSKSQSLRFGALVGLPLLLQAGPLQPPPPVIEPQELRTTVAAPAREVAAQTAAPGSAASPAVAVSASTAPMPWKEALRQKAPFFKTPAAVVVADYLLPYQLDCGGWPKNTDFSKPPKANYDRGANGTIDNQATTTPLRFLAEVISAGQGKPAHTEAFLKGFDYLLASQYPNGGWPQFFPLKKGYATHITYNDGAMANVLFLLRDASEGKAPYGFLDAQRKAAAAQAVAKGVECVLKSQYRRNGVLTVWCAQHDEKTLLPAAARAFEPVSLSGNESVGIVRFLMTIENPSPEVVQAVDAAVAWFEKNKIQGLRVESFTAADGKPDRRAVEDPKAEPLWARFYELETDRPIYIGRDKEFHYAYNEIERERRVGYSYLGPYADDLLAKLYPRWKAARGK